ncbi:NAD(P)H-dependent oxidoreductase subunit E [Plantactinospora sp. KLBMP9567]|uniref:NAD(P)H-dependent oxidoreductase subunit E n=1 Tax=Plantactinospora sp. KLBMP9567 TaxID=3085900 RepID=UPI0029820B45|nr:NAD(P)H-dependent oxidoreductase subunit E [Plantactinospora sp. KLBMP9567]MDW5329593.1 NAD(P)H-dependent oxidoreductase subunit E [Plantactinospora sp. KLBMP9567]
MAEPREAFVGLQARLGRPGTSLLERLRRVQRERGGIDAGELTRLAGEFGLPVAAVTGTVSFYADFAEGCRGRRHVRVCEGASCFASTGGQHIRDLERVLGVRRGTCASDGSVSLQAVRCLGYCYDSPAVLDGERPGTGGDLGGLLDGPSGAGSGPDAPVRTPPPIPYESRVDPPVVLAGLLGAEGEWQVWPEVVTSGSPERVKHEVAASGLRGRGGAGFPTAKKWSMAAGEPGPRYVIANGDEGDPGSYCDRLLMERDPHRILEGLALAAFAVEAHHGLVLVRSEYPAAIARMCAAVAEAREAGHLGRQIYGSGFDFDVEVVEGAGSYVAGEETALMHAVSGLRGDARPRPPYPTSKGFLARPTALNNVETLAAVPWVVQHGGDAYARLGHPDEPGTKLVCLSQLFRRPGVYEVEYGVPLRHLVEELGGGLRDGHMLRAVQVGGPLGGFLTPDQLDLPLLTKPLAQAGVPLGHASLIAFDTEMPAAAILRHEWAFGAAESCGACTPCRVGTRRGLELAERIGEPGQAAGVLARQEPLLEVLDAASLCAFGRGVACAVRSVSRAYSDELSRSAP